LGKAESNLSLKINAVDQFTQPFKDFGDSVNSATKNVREYGKAAKDAGKTAEEATGFQKLKAQFKAFGEASSKVGGALKDIALRAGAIGVAAGGVIAGLYAITKSYTDVGDAAAKTAQKIGITAETWQEMTHVANLSGVSTDQLKDGYAKLNKAMFDAAQGGKTQLEAFKKLGITLKNSKGELKANDEMMLEVADALAKMPEGAEKAALAMALFGESGINLLPMLNMGKQGIMDARREAEEFGLVMSNQAAKDSEAFNDAVTNLQERLTGLKQIVGGALVPAFTELIGGFSQLIDENRDLIKVKVAEYAEKFKAMIPTILKAVKTLVGYIPKAIGVVEWLVETFGVGKLAGAGLAVTFGGPVISAIRGLIGMVKTAGPIISTFWGFISGPLNKVIWLLGHFRGMITIVGYALKALTLNPIGIFIMVMVAALKIISEYYGGWDEWIRLCDDSLTMMGQDIKAVAGWIWDKMVKAFEWLMEVMSPVVDVFKAIGAAIYDFLEPAIKASMAAIQPLIDSLKTAWDLLMKIAGSGPKSEEQLAKEKQADKENQGKRFQIYQEQYKQGKISKEQLDEARQRVFNPGSKGSQSASSMVSPLASPPALGGAAAMPVTPAGAGGATETKHTEEKIEKVEMNLNLPPGVTMTPTTGPVPGNVRVTGRGPALGMANG
jgi:hypothetical protein